MHFVRKLLLYFFNLMVSRHLECYLEAGINWCLLYVVSSSGFYFSDSSVSLILEINPSKISSFIFIYISLKYPIFIYPFLSNSWNFYANSKFYLLMCTSSLYNSSFDFLLVSKLDKCYSSFSSFPYISLIFSLFKSYDDSPMNLSILRTGRLFRRGSLIWYL